MSFLLCLHLVQGSRFRALVAASPPFFIGRCPKVVFKSRFTSHNNDTSRPLETEVPQRDFRVWPNPKRRLACPFRRLPVRPNGPRQRRRMDPRSGVKDYVRLPVSLKRHPDRSGGSFVVWRQLHYFFRRWYSRIAAFPGRGRCPAGADRVTMV